MREFYSPSHNCTLAFYLHPVQNAKHFLACSLVCFSQDLSVSQQYFPLTAASTSRIYQPNQSAIRLAGHKRTFFSDNLIIIYGGNHHELFCFKKAIKCMQHIAIGKAKLDAKATLEAVICDYIHNLKIR